ncbi:hypothetical protein C8R48DRAFT_680488 [Suillus tomentosus]|nr:hypothetical protein C8R48DRAFT_680488 [Suillus tomentosus]
MSSCIANLPTYLQIYSVGITLRPKEFNIDQLQHFMKNYIDDVLALYDNGIFNKTPENPDGSEFPARDGQEHIRCMILPMVYLLDQENMLPDQVGYPAGGSLTSDEWKCLSLVFGPIVIPLIWDEWTPISQAKHLLHEHLIQFIKIYPIDVKPMHHWLTHIFYPLRDNGPVYKFWTFLFERLNKILKSYSTNYHGAGELELGDILAAETLADENDVSRLVVDCIRLMLATEGDTLGTVASLGLHRAVKRRCQRGIERESVLLDVKWFRRKLDINLRHSVQHPELEDLLWEHEMFLIPLLKDFLS